MTNKGDWLKAQKERDTATNNGGGSWASGDSATYTVDTTRSCTSTVGYDGTNGLFVTAKRGVNWWPAQFTASDNTKEQPGMRLFNYAATYTPTGSDGNADREKSRVLVDPGTMLETSKAAVERRVLRMIEDDGTLDWDSVDVIVTPFGG